MRQLRELSKQIRQTPDSKISLEQLDIIGPGAVYAVDSTQLNRVAVYAGSYKLLGPAEEGNLHTVRLEVDRHCDLEPGGLIIEDYLVKVNYEALSDIGNAAIMATLVPYAAKIYEQLLTNNRTVLSDEEIKHKYDLYDRLTEEIEAKRLVIDPQDGHIDLTQLTV